MTRALVAGLVLAVCAAAVAWASNSVTVQPPSTGSPWTLTLPNSAGTSGYILTTDGSGNTSWVSDAGTASTALSGITAASGTNTINSTNNAQIWQWGTLSTQTAMTLTTSSMTTGTLLSLSNTSTPSHAGTVLSVVNGEAGASYALSATNSGAANTGYAGYFNNTSTTGWSVYAPGAAPNYFGGYVNLNGNSTRKDPLTIQTDSTSDSTMAIQRVTNATDRAMIAYIPAGALSSSNVAWYTGELANDNNFSIDYYNGTTMSTALYLQNNGNVSIGTTSGSVPLYVFTATAAAIVETLQNGSATCTHKPTTGSETVSCSSDARLKADIRDAGSALPWLNSIRVRDYTEKASGQKRTGVIAQEMLGIHPDMVHRDTSGLYTVDEPNPWKLVKAAQEQQEEITGLQADNNKLQQQVDALAAKVAK
jgi:hypothetical protein